MSAHLDKDHALFLVALAEDDPEKRAALAHAEGCAACNALLHEGRAMLVLLDRADEQVAVEPALEARILESVRSMPAVRRFGWEYLAWVFGGLFSALLILIDGRPDRPLAPEIGLRCARFELVLAGLALCGTLAFMRFSSARLGPLRGSVVAMTGALVGQVLLRTRCEAPDAALHLLVFHGLGVVLATALGGAVGLGLARAAR